MMLQIKHNRPKIISRNLLKIFLAVLLVFFLNFFSGFRSFLIDFASFFLKTGDSVYKTAEHVPQKMLNKDELLSQNNDLWDQLENCRLDLLDYQIIKDENQKLRDALNMKPDGNVLTALIIARPPQIPLDSLFLNAGENFGLRGGDLVLASKRALIGKVVEISKSKSVVALNSFAGQISYGFVARTDESIEIKGVGGGNMEVKVPIDFDIKIGDEILTNSDASYLMALVGVIEEDNSSGFKNIIMSLPVNVSKIRSVFVEPQI